MEDGENIAGADIFGSSISDTAGRRDVFNPYEEGEAMGSVHDILNEYGDAGWELISIKLFKDDNIEKYYFKREK
jgi:hypothetical protein